MAGRSLSGRWELRFVGRPDGAAGVEVTPGEPERCERRKLNEFLAGQRAFDGLAGDPVPERPGFRVLYEAGSAFARLEGQDVAVDGAGECVTGGAIGVEHGDDVGVSDGLVDYWLVIQMAEWESHGVVADVDTEHELFAHEAVVRVFLAKYACGAGELTPKRLGLTAIHDERVHDQLPADAEIKGLVIDLAGIHDARKAERSPGDRDWAASEGVVDDFVAAEKRDAIGASFAVDLDADH